MSRAMNLAMIAFLWVIGTFFYDAYRFEGHPVPALFLLSAGFLIVVHLVRAIRE